MTSSHLLELQKEIKADEEELFADLNSLINSRDYLFSKIDDDYQRQPHSDPDPDPDPDPEPDLLDDDEDEVDDEEEREVDDEYDDDDDQEDEDDGINLDDDDDEEEANPASIKYPNEHAYAPPDDENYQTIIQQVTSSLPKPCVFFLEGNCRRSDCKYSHDISGVTCKYWIGGFCFKGQECPFLHSYIPPGDSQNDLNLDDDTIELLAKSEKLNPTFAIESEADFPSLPLDAPPVALTPAESLNTNSAKKVAAGPKVITNKIKNQILSSNSAVVFKTSKKKRKKS